jgi:glucosylceramidase
MKNTGVHNEGFLKPEYYSSWALYFSKYLTAYKKNEISIWGVTPQNEPEAYKQAWDACGWTPEQMNDFVKNHLGPQLKKDHSKVKLIAWDHNKNHMMKWCNILLKDKETAPYFSYIAHHWYEDGEAKYFEPLQEATKAFPQYPLIAAEQGVFGLYLLKPEPAELYAKDIIGNMNNNSVAWVAWGMAFDHTGGPNHAKNFNHSPIMIDVDKANIHYNPSYYYIAHFSKYVKEGAYRIDFKTDAKDIHVTAFKNPDDQLVFVALNTTDKTQDIQVKIEKEIIKISLNPHSIATVLY